MASESQPPGVQEGSSTPPPPVASKEDQKTAAALSNMDTNGEDASGSASRKEVDTEALGKAMQNLSTKNGAAPPAAAKKAVVKVAAADVTLLVEQLELSKPKATELLKAHEGDAVKAMTAFVKTSA